MHEALKIRQQAILGREQAGLTTAFVDLAEDFVYFFQDPVRSPKLFLPKSIEYLRRHHWATNSDQLLQTDAEGNVTASHSFQ